MSAPRYGLVAALAIVGLAACEPPPQPGAPPAGIARVLGGTPPSGFARALVSRPLQFPADHGAHPEFQTEWWYFTGHLQTPQRQLGYQLTFFRQALQPPPDNHTGPWSAHQIYMAHFTLTDLTHQQFHARQRLSRARPGLAWSAQDRLTVAVEDWSVTQTQSQLQLEARDHDLAIDLQLTLAGPVMLHGDAGLSRKSSTPGNASYYYSMPRLATTGTVSGPFGTEIVTGTSWLDREWSTSVLAADQVGWDWFSLNLGAATDLMLYQLRDAAGRTHPYSAGTLRIGAQTHALSAADFSLRPTRTWQSNATGARYPVAWHLTVPRFDLTLDVTALVDNQELDLAFLYWEGAVAAQGNMQHNALRGSGYLEMTGYPAAPTRQD